MPAKITTRRSTIHGNGMFATAPLKKGERLIQYKGRHRTHKAVDRIYADEVETGHTFLFTLNDTYVIDANEDGNAARWINHSCDPNCEAVLEEDEGDDRRKDKVFIEAMREIAPGEELSYNYGIRLDEKHTKELKKIWECRCGSPKCTGTMLQPKKVKSKKKVKKNKKGKKK
jgi:SET domain-containing protein